MTNTNITTVSLPKKLVEKVKERIADTGFNSVSSYVAYVLRQVLSNVEEKESEVKKDPFSKKDEEKVKARLRSLGYLD